MDRQLSHDERINRVKQYIHRCANKGLSREVLAGWAGYSVVHLHRLFQAHTGKTISAYARQVRLEWAARQLLAGDSCVTNVAFACGYKTHSAFGRAFKQHFCISPSAFRDLHPTTAARLIHSHIPSVPYQRKDGDLVKRIPLTGLSGTGKSSVISELSARGYRAVDADYGGYSEWVEVVDDSETPGEAVEPGRDWVWNERRIRELLSAEEGHVLFLAGTSPNMGQFLPRFDHVILLSAPKDVMAERLRTRTNNPYGQQTGEIERALGLVETVEPLLRKAAGHEIDTSVGLDEVVSTVLKVADKN